MPSLLFLKCLLAARLTLFTLSTLLWVGSCNHRILACFLWYKNREHSSSNHGLCTFHTGLDSIRHLIFSLMFLQSLFMSSLSCKFSKAANLFQILIWYSFLTSSSLNSLRLNLSTSYFCALVYLLPILHYLLQPPDNDQYHTQLPWKIVHRIHS
jgi:hypothetical protein